MPICEPRAFPVLASAPATAELGSIALERAPGCCEATPAAAATSASAWSAVFTIWSALRTPGAPVAPRGALAVA